MKSLVKLWSKIIWEAKEQRDHSGHVKLEEATAFHHQVMEDKILSLCSIKDN